MTINTSYGTVNKWCLLKPYKFMLLFHEKNVFTNGLLANFMLQTSLQKKTTVFECLSLVLVNLDRNFVHLKNIYIIIQEFYKGQE